MSDGWNDRQADPGGFEPLADPGGQATPPGPSRLPVPPPNDFMPPSGSPADGSPFTGQAGQGTPGLPGAVPRAPQRSFVHANQQSIVAIGFAALYLVLAATVHVVMLGIIPLLASIRALGRKEPIAPIALACSGLVMVLAFTSLT